MNKDTTDKTLVIVTAPDGRRVEKIFSSYEEATAWVHENTKKHDIELGIEEARFDREPTIEIYKEIKDDR